MLHSFDVFGKTDYKVDMQNTELRRSLWSKSWTLHNF